MDNLTHTLIGATLARALPERADSRAVFWTAVLANNAPDIDVIGRWLGSTPLEMLVSHRGLTHTFVAALPLGLICAGVGAAIGRERVSRSLVLWGMLNIGTHLGADFLNSYGVHPFSPFWNHWFYGDSMFIAEPLIWMALLPPLIWDAQTRVARSVWTALALAALGLVWMSPIPLPLFNKVAVTALGAGMSLVHWRPKPLVALATLFAVVSANAAMGTYARALVRGSHLHRWNRQETLLDVESTPLPGDPSCWHSWVRAATEEQLITREVMVPLFGRKAADCPSWRAKNATMPLAELPPPAPEERVIWLRESRQSLRELREWRDRSCRMRLLLSFARFPFVRAEETPVIAGDFRYDREPGIGFSETEVADESNCRVTPRWSPPAGQDFSSGDSNGS